MVWIEVPCSRTFQGYSFDLQESCHGCQEEPPDLTREIPVHPINTWLPQLAQKSGRNLVLDGDLAISLMWIQQVMSWSPKTGPSGVEVPRATWFTTTKRLEKAPDANQANGKPNFKRFRKAQCRRPSFGLLYVRWLRRQQIDASKEVINYIKL